MGKSIPVELPSITFSKKKDAIEFFQNMLGRYKNGDHINEIDSIYLYELTLRHPEEKIGKGVAYFYKDKNLEYPTSGFHIQRTDGSKTDFSYLKCIDGKKPSPREYFYKACRFAVSDYLSEEKNDLFDQGQGFCSQTGEAVTKETSEYCHTQPAFIDLINDFAEKESINICYDIFVDDQDIQYSVRFKDPTIASRFIDFHKKLAHMALFKK